MRRYKITLAIVCTLLGNIMSVEQRKQGKNRNSRRRNKIAIREATGQTAGESHILEIQLLQKSYIDDNTKLPGCTIDIHISYPSGGNTGNTTLNKLQSLFVASLPDGMQESHSPRTAVEHFVKNYIADYQAEIKPYLKKHKHRDEGG